MPTPEPTEGGRAPGREPGEKGGPAAKLLAVVGPTASGKTTIAVELSERLGGEIVSCDSVQVYRELEIGCAKPTPQERRRATHHLVDVVSWDEPFDAQRFREHARAAIADIRGRGRVPILCGGTGLYLRALRYGLMPAPAADTELRERLMSEERAEPGVLFRRLQEVDPETAGRTDAANLVYVVRALEIFLQSGTPASALRAAHAFAAEEVPMQVVALRWPDAVLRKRIEQRTAAMLERGLVQEVERLLAAGVRADCRPMRSVGYREACDVVLGDAPAEGLQERIVRSTWAYARRQRTWLRRERDIQWLDVRTVESTAAEILRGWREGDGSSPSA